MIKTPLVLSSLLLVLCACGGGGSSGGGSGGSSSSGGNSSGGNGGSACDSDCVRINEAVSSNTSVIDNDGDTPDWFELYNSGSSTISIENWTITDDNTEPDKWAFPNVSISANGYLLVWASDKDYSDVANSVFHTNFKIASDPGETLYLYDAQGRLVDSLEVFGLPTGFSVGINSNNSQGVFIAPTPGSVNSVSSYEGIVTSEIAFSHPGGEFDDAMLSISGAGSNEVIRYTLDGTIPSSDDPRYTGALPISDDTVIRARIFRDGWFPSLTANRTLVVNRNHDLPIVTLVTEPDNFFDQDTGIYAYGDEYENQQPFYGANFWEDWETDIYLAFYDEADGLGFDLNAGVKIFGGWSRANAQRSLSIFARERYGTGKIDYPLFPELGYQEFESFVLRNGGNDWNRAMFRDAFMTKLVADTGIEMQAYQPVASYLNGTYWGLYNIREKVNEHFIASKSGFDKDEIDLLEREGELIHGDNADYLALTTFLETNSLSGESNFQYVADQIDVENFMIYNIANIYFNNQDWPGNNIKYWRGPGQKWRWILFDTDFGFGIYNKSDYSDDTLSFALETAGPDWPNPPWSTLILRRLMANDVFRNNFINRFADELNTRFQPTAVNTLIDAMAAQIATEVPRQQGRWGYIVDWQDEVDQMKNWAQQRPFWLWMHIQNEFGLSARHTLSLNLNNASQGTVRLNYLTIDETSWSGDYFEGVPVELEAVPAPGFVFSGWTGDLESTENVISLSLTADTNIEAVFVAE